MVDPPSNESARPSLASRVQSEVLRRLPLSSDEIPSLLLPTFSGTVAFASALAASTYGQLRLLGVSTGSVSPLPTLFGVASVGAASVFSQWVAVGTYDVARRQWGIEGGRVFDTNDDGEERRRRTGSALSWHGTNIGCNAHTLRVCALGLIAFKLLGGRFWSVSPSSYTHLGSFARASLPATMRYGTAKERAAIERIGRIFGCHTCGSRVLIPRSGGGGVKFHADHMPPKAVAEQMNRRWHRRLLGRTVRQRFYPQCVDCSNAQGGLLAGASNELRKHASSGRLKLLGIGAGGASLKGAGGGRAAHFHGLRPRVHHLAGGVVAAATVCGAEEEDVLDGHPTRFERWQDAVEGVFRTFGP